MKPGENKINEILESLDGLKKATAPAYFYTRLKARMEREQEAKLKRHWMLRPAYAIITLVLVLLVNAAVILQKQESTEPAMDDTELMTSFAAEYSLNDNSILYDPSTDQ